MSGTVAAAPQCWQARGAGLWGGAGGCWGSLTGPVEAVGVHSELQLLPVHMRAECVVDWAALGQGTHWAPQETGLERFNLATAIVSEWVG